MMSMKSLVLAGAVLSTAVCGQGELQVGDEAPEIRIAEWLQGSAEDPRTLAELRGRVVVLEFWAASCGACISAFAHLNELAAEFEGGDEVVFLSLGQGDKTALQKVLDRVPLDTLVGLDAGRASFEAYGVRVIPHTVVVDANGAIAAVTSPWDLTASALRAVAAGQAIDLPFKSNRSADLEWDSGQSSELDPPASLCQLRIEPSLSASGATHFVPGSGRLVADGLGVQSVVQLAYGAQHNQVEWLGPRPSEEQVYRLAVTTEPGDDDRVRGLLQAAVRSSFGLSARWEDREQEVLVLRRVTDPVEGALVPFDPNGKWTGDSMMFGGGIRMRKTGIAAIARWFGNVTGQPVVDETGLEGFFSANVTWVPGDRETFEQAVADLGLELAPERRTVAKLVVRRD